MGVTGARIKAARITMGLTQAELAEKVGLKFSAIHKYEAGLVVNIKRNTIEQLASVLQISPAYLMGWTDDPNDTEDPNLLRRDAMYEQAETLLKHAGYSVDVVDDDVAVIKNGASKVISSVDKMVAVYEWFDQRGISPTAEQLIQELNNDPQPAESRPEVTDDDIKFALFGTTEIDQDVYEDVKALARMYAERAQPKNKEKP